MIVARGGSLGKTIVARFVVGEDLLESMTNVCKEEGIRNGIILTGFGSVSRAAASGADTDQFPPNKFYAIDKKEGIEVLDLSAAFSRAVREDGDETYFVPRGHYSPRGHELVAREFGDWVNRLRDAEDQ